MKKTIFILTIIVLAIVLFFYFTEKKSSKTEEKRDKTISNDTTLKKEKIKEPSKNELPKLDLELNVDKNEFYKNQMYDKTKALNKDSIKEKKDFDYDINVDINKENKEIDSLNIKLEKKF